MHALNVRQGLLANTFGIAHELSCHCVGKPETPNLLSRETRNTVLKAFNLGPPDSTMRPDRHRLETPLITQIHHVLATAPEKCCDVAG